MIPYDFEYYKPLTRREALDILRDVQSKGKKAIFYSGGTEIITFSRINQLYTEAVIDIKGIPDCHVLEFQDDELIIGAGVSLNKITESNLFPLLGQTVKQVADHTSRNKITIGGNLNSKLIYREAVLPLLLTDARVMIASHEGEAILPLNEAFNQELKIGTEQLLLQILIRKDCISSKYVHFKRTKFTKVGYPIVSISAMVKDKKIRAAFSGVCAYPFRSAELEALLNNTAISIEERVEQTIKQLPSPILDDIQASKDYREFVFKNTLQDTLEVLKEGIS